MANPIKVDIPKNTWTKVATNVIDGIITIKQWQASRYFQTYRVTGDPAPTGNQNEDTATETTCSEIVISAIAGIDVYMFCIQYDGEVVVAL